MREIKFRYWMHWKHNSDNGWMEYFELDPIKLPKLVHTGPKETTNKFPRYFRNFVAERYSEDQLDYAVMQYTGLKDKSGKEIYEGDICLAALPEERFRVPVIYCTSLSGFLFEWPDNTYESGMDEMSMDCFTDIEVIGNIYENPELLGDKQ